MRVTVVLFCAAPGVGGPQHLPTVPVKVSVYVPFGVLQLVVIMARLCWVPDGFSHKHAGSISQLEWGGSPLAESATLPLNPFTEAKLSSQRAMSPARILSVAEQAQILKSVKGEILATNAFWA
jgi:hypothetical protein